MRMGTAAARWVRPATRLGSGGAWSGLGGIATAVGPFVGGWLIDTVSWRLAFFVNVPFAALVVLASRHVPETRSDREEHLDGRGAAAASVGLALVTYGLIERSV